MIGLLHRSKFNAISSHFRNPHKKFSFSAKPLLNNREVNSSTILLSGVEVKNNKSEDAFLDLVKTLQKTVDDLIFKCKEREESFGALASFIINTPNPSEIVSDWQVKSHVY